MPGRALWFLGGTFHLAWSQFLCDAVAVYQKSCRDNKGTTTFNQVAFFRSVCKKSKDVLLAYVKPKVLREEGMNCGTEFVIHFWKRRPLQYRCSKVGPVLRPEYVVYETDSNKRKRNHSNANTKSHGQKNQCSTDVKARRIFLFPPALLKFVLNLVFSGCVNDYGGRDWGLADKKFPR